MTVKLTTSDVDSCAVAKTGGNCLVSPVEVKSEIEGFRYAPIVNKTGEDVRTNASHVFVGLARSCHDVLAADLSVQYPTSISFT